VRVLVVEDEHRVASYICQALIEESFVVDLAHDGLRALELTAEHQHDAIVLDLMLPGLDGLTVCRRVREARATTPILILSARDLVEDRVRGLDAGADVTSKASPLLRLRAHPLRIALVGNPNVGKSVFFGRLTGRYATVSNYPGTTVTLTRGRALVGAEVCEIVDTPG